MQQENNINTFSPYKTLEQIHQGIEDYFDCRLTDGQEEQLRQVLCSTQYHTPEIDECLAVMGFQTIPQMRVSKQPVQMVGLLKKNARRTWIAVAASFLVAIAIAVPLLINNRITNGSRGDREGDCYAYVEGCKITDEDVVLRMLMEDLGEFDQSINQINDDFGSTMEYLSQIIEENENPL